MPDLLQQEMNESQSSLGVRGDGVRVPDSFAVGLEQILVPIDFSPASRQGLKYAASLAARFHAQLHLLHVVEPPTLPQWGYARIPRREARLRRAASERLPQLIAECGVGSELVASTQVGLGVAEDEICDAASGKRADLIVLASHGLGGLQRAFIGSTAERVVRQAPCPVLTVRESVLREDRSGSGGFDLRRILVTTDFSDESKKSLPYAAALAEKFRASLVLLHVVPAHLPSQLSHFGLVLAEQRLVKEAADRLPAFRKTELDPDLRVDTLVLSGSPAHVICRTVEAERADLVILSTHGHTGLKHFQLGSVTENVVRHATCPVLAVREREHDFVMKL